MSKLLYAADFHGNRHAYDALFDLATELGIKTVILGGDLTPKRLALKLKDSTNWENGEGEEMKPGAVIPMNFINRSRKSRSYTESLQRIKTLNEIEGPDALASSLEQDGHIIHRIENGYFVLDDMLLMSKIMDQLNDYFSSEDHLSRKPLEFPDYEMDLIGDYIIPKLEEIENNFSDNKKTDLRNLWNSLIESIRDPYTPPKFSRLCLSSTLMNYLRFKDKLSDIEKVHARASKSLNPIFGRKIDSQVARHFTNNLDELLRDVRIAETLVPLQHLIYLGGLHDGADIDKIKELTEGFDLYIKGQKEFVNGYLKDKLTHFKDQNPGAEVYAIFGNDDMTEVEEEIRGLNDLGLINYLNQDVLALPNGLSIAGYPFVRPSEDFYAGWQKKEEAILQDLEKLASKSDPKNTIYVIHSPPHNCKLDIAYNEEHIGSTAVREFIERHQPLAVLSGHVHESFTKSNTIMEQMGTTFCYNTGGKHSKDKLCAAIIDMNNPGNFQFTYEVN